MKKIILFLSVMFLSVMLCGTGYSGWNYCGCCDEDRCADKYPCEECEVCEEECSDCTNTCNMECGDLDCANLTCPELVCENDVDVDVTCPKCPKVYCGADVCVNICPPCPPVINNIECGDLDCSDLYCPELVCPACGDTDVNVSCPEVICGDQVCVNICPDIPECPACDVDVVCPEPPPCPDVTATQFNMVGAYLGTGNNRGLSVGFMTIEWNGDEGMAISCVSYIGLGYVCSAFVLDKYEQVK